MASPELMSLLETLYETGKQKPLRWEPVRRDYSDKCDFAIALGSGVIHLSGKDNDPGEWNSSFRLTLMTRDGYLVDEFEAGVHESPHYPQLRDLYYQARDAAFNMTRMIDEMKAEARAGKTRDLPKDSKPSYNPHDVPF
jgi:hypothetical protein